MISKLIIATFLLSSAANATVLVLSEQQEKSIVDRLNDVCADSWCEGPFNILFTSVSFEKSGTKEFYSVRLNAEDTYSKNHISKNVVCQIEDVDLIQDIVKTPNNQVSASETKFYTLVDECIAKNLSVQDLQN